MSSKSFIHEIISETAPSFDSCQKWLQENFTQIREDAQTHGASLVKGLKIDSIEEFKVLANQLNAIDSEYHGGASPRSNVSNNVFTATEMDHRYTILFHNELAYSNTVPGALIFYCEQPAEKMGETVLSDCRELLNILSNEERKQITENKITYLRRLRSENTRGVSESWQQVFKSATKEEVEEHCHDQGYDFAWEKKDGLKLMSHKPLISKHPITGEDVFFNGLFIHRHWFHPQFNPLYNALGKDRVTSDATWEDGSEIAFEFMQRLYDKATQVSKPVQWEQGDLLYLDNYNLSHSRNPYEGERKLYVSMLDMKEN